MAVSPTGRFIAYKRFEPRWADEEDVILVYDVAQSATLNRMESDGGRFGKLRDAGTPVYPTWNQVTRSYTGRLSQAGELPEDLRSPLTWIDSSTLAFLMCQCTESASDSVLRAVVVDISPNVASPAIRRREIDANALVDTKTYDEKPVSPAHVVFAKAIAPLEVLLSSCRLRISLTEVTGRKVTDFEIEV